MILLYSDPTPLSSKSQSPRIRFVWVKPRRAPRHDQSHEVSTTHQNPLGIGVLYDVPRLCDISFVALIGSLAFLEGAGVRGDLINLVRAEAENEEEP